MSNIILVQYEVISYLAYTIGHFTNTAPVCKAFYFSVLQLILGFSQNLLESSGSNSVFTRHTQRRCRKWFPSARIHVSHVTRLLHVKFCWWYWRHCTLSAFLQFFGESTIHTSALSRAESKNARVKAQTVLQYELFQLSYWRKHRFCMGDQEAPRASQLPYSCHHTIWPEVSVVTPFLLGTTQCLFLQQQNELIPQAWEV